jgi:hypothetical protein
LGAQTRLRAAMSKAGSKAGNALGNCLWSCVKCAQLLFWIKFFSEDVLNSIGY